MNGSSIFWRGRYGGDYPKNGEVPIMAFFFDINGSKGPNIVGHDLFSFVYYETYGFLPYGWFNPSGCISENSDGFSCAYYVFKNGKMDYIRKK